MPSRTGVADVLKRDGHTVRVQDFDIRVGDVFIERMHEMLEQCRHLIVILSRDYFTSGYTTQEWTNFIALSNQSGGERRLIPIRIEDFPLPGLFAARVCASLIGVTDRDRRREIIIQAATGRRPTDGPPPPAPKRFTMCRPATPASSAAAT